MVFLSKQPIPCVSLGSVVLSRCRIVVRNLQVVMRLTATLLRSVTHTNGENEGENDRSSKHLVITILVLDTLFCFEGVTT